MLTGPYNNNPARALTRALSVCGLPTTAHPLPDCEALLNVFDQVTMKDLDSETEATIHGQLHMQLGGAWDCAEDLRTIVDVHPALAEALAGVGLLEFNFELILGQLSSDRELTCPGFCSEDTPFDDCRCSCPFLNHSSVNLTHFTERHLEVPGSGRTTTVCRATVSGVQLRCAVGDRGAQDAQEPLRSSAPTRETTVEIHLAPFPSASPPSPPIQLSRGAVSRRGAAINTEEQWLGTEAAAKIEQATTDAAERREVQALFVRFVIEPLAERRGIDHVKQTFAYDEAARSWSFRALAVLSDRYRAFEPLLESVCIALMCTPPKLSQFSSPFGSANDPLFWPIHTGFERIWAYLRTFRHFNSTWGDSVTMEGNNLTAWGFHSPLEPFGRPEHALFDDASLAPPGGDRSYTNAELVQLFDPQAEHLTHIWDDVAWDHCDTALRAEYTRVPSTAPTAPTATIPTSQPTAPAPPP